MFIRQCKRVIPFFLLIFLASCGDSESSSENSNSDSITSNDAVVTVSQRSVDAGSPFTLNYQLGNTASKQTRSKDAVGTVHWGDNTTDRISGSGEIQHTYTAAGTFSVNIQVDGGSLIRLGDITVTAVTRVVPSTIFSSPSSGTTFVVPGGVTSLAVTAIGASGADGTLYGITSKGGEGGISRATITVTPGETLTLIIGGTDGTGGGGAKGSGGNAGNGGGRTAIERAGNPLIVAGGGGGAGSSHLCGNGGNGGGASGGNGGHSGGNRRGLGGSGGIGGSGGTSVINSAGASGTATNGGKGGNGSNGGGGGGGGYGGGGGGGGGSGIGGACGGGGGGFAPGGTTSAGGNIGNGKLIIDLL